jgi:hypothetical protein
MAQKTIAAIVQQGIKNGEFIGDLQWQRIFHQNVRAA